MEAVREGAPTSAHGFSTPSLAPTRYPAPGYCSLHAEDRLTLVTDGVTDAENASGDFFGDWRLETVAEWRDVGQRDLPQNN